MRILWVSNAPFMSTGYGAQTALMLPRLRDAGHEVAVFANAGTTGAVTEWDGFRIYPNEGGWGNDMLPFAADDWFGDNPGQIITLYDAWTFDPKAYARWPVACWTPIDHSPIPPKVNRWFTESESTPIAMSEFGRDSLTVNGFRPEYAPHGIDTRTFCQRDRKKARGLTACAEEEFLVGMVAANIGVNPSRKGFDLAMVAFRALKEVVPEAKLYIHTEMTGCAGRGVDLRALASQVGISPDDLWFADQSRYRLGTISDEEMSYMYSAFDVLLAPSLGEGFGIPVMEAQACGTPVIVSDGSAQRELCGAGWTTRTQPSYDPLQAADWHMPILTDLVTNLALAYQAKGDLSFRDSAREFADLYEADRVFDEYWTPILKSLEENLPNVEPIAV